MRTPPHSKPLAFPSDALAEAIDGGAAPAAAPDAPPSGHAQRRCATVPLMPVVFRDEYLIETNVPQTKRNWRWAQGTPDCYEVWTLDGDERAPGPTFNDFGAALSYANSRHPGCCDILMPDGSWYTRRATAHSFPATAWASPNDSAPPPSAP